MVRAEGVLFRAPRPGVVLEVAAAREGLRFEDARLRAGQGSESLAGWIVVAHNVFAAGLSDLLCDCAPPRHALLLGVM